MQQEDFPFYSEYLANMFHRNEMRIRISLFSLTPNDRAVQIISIFLEIKYKCYLINCHNYKFSFLLNNRKNIHIF